MDSILDPDVELMLRVQAGDRPAFEALVGKYQRPLVNLIGRYLGAYDDAEDLAQEVFIRVHRAAPRYQPTAKFSTWLYTIARRLCANHARGRALRRWFTLSRDAADAEDDSPDEGRDVADPADDPSVTAEKRQLRRVVAQALSALPDTLRSAVILRRYEELSYEEIATIVGCSVTAAKLRVHRAKSILAKRLAPYAKDAES
ncbi:MAG: sigma-70 family RNA polymerase sigma factor [Nitrospirae bacterium]|nr:sigma-70 family RNA polymerase sigma factor [Nitrospirota bacterium]